MRAADVPRLRSHNLKLDGSELSTPEAVVSWHGAIQAQEYGPARWSLAQRAPGVTADDVDKALAEGRVVRTHVLRPTWHLVARDDLRGLLELTGPRIQRGNAARHRELGLDAATLRRAVKVMTRALASGEHLTRAELGERIAGAGIDTTGQRLPHMLGHAELELAICSGAPRGAHHTYAGFDDVVPAGATADATDVTRGLIEKYLRSHGPSSVADIQWWASLRASEVRAALHELDANTETIDGTELWWFDAGIERARSEVRLLETFDEFIVGYTKSRFFGDPWGERAAADWRGRARIVTRGGRILGLWTRRKTRSHLAVDVMSYEPVSAAAGASLKREARRLAAFSELELDLAIKEV